MYTSKHLGKSVNVQKLVLKEPDDGVNALQQQDREQRNRIFCTLTSKRNKQYIPNVLNYISVDSDHTAPCKYKVIPGIRRENGEQLDM